MSINQHAGLVRTGLTGLATYVRYLAIKETAAPSFPFMGRTYGGVCWNLLSAASGPTGVNNGDNRVTCTGAIALLI
jgi:hypothetical protein